MDLYDWLLFLHVLSAFLLVGGLTALWALILGTRAPAPGVDAGAAMSFGRLGGILVGVGMVGTIVFGIWLAIEVDGYEVWDAWIVASLVLWAFGGWAGGKGGKEFAADPVAGRRAGIRFQGLSTLAVLAILVLMIWKPGA
jgi:uncharacterized membrane protein